MQKSSKSHISSVRKTILIVLCALLVVAVVVFVRSYHGRMTVAHNNHQTQMQAVDKKLETLRSDMQAAIKPADMAANTTAQIKAAYTLAKTAAYSLQNGQDVETAKMLLQLAADHLAPLNGPKVEQAKKIIEADQAKLNAVTAPDMRKLQLKLATLDKLINVMPVYGASELPVKTNTPVANNQTAKPWYSAITNIFSDLKSVVRIRKKGENEITVTEMSIARAQFKLLIEQLRWATFYNNAEVYEHSLQNAQTLLPQVFDANSESVQKFAKILDELKNTKLNTEIPSIQNSVNALHAILVG